MQTLCNFIWSIIYSLCLIRLVQIRKKTRTLELLYLTENERNRSLAYIQFFVETFRWIKVLTYSKCFAVNRASISGKSLVHVGCRLCSLLQQAKLFRTHLHVSCIYINFFKKYISTYNTFTLTIIFTTDSYQLTLVTWKP